MPTYHTTTRNLTATPRRLHGKASTTSTDATTPATPTGSSSTIIQGSGSTTNNHTHANIDDLDRLHFDPQDYLTATDRGTTTTAYTRIKAGFADTATHATKADTATQAHQADQATHADEATTATHATTADEATHATEATHAQTADDLTQWTTADRRYLSRINDDTASGNIHFRQSIQSPRFTPGLTGEGWQVNTDTTTGQTTIEADRLTLRGPLIATQLIVRTVRALCGSLGITQACGKVRSVNYLPARDMYQLILEGTTAQGYGGFQAGDYIRCQRWNSDNLTLQGYWVQIYKVESSGKILVIEANQFTSTIIPGTGQTADHTQSHVDITTDTGTPITDDTGHPIRIPAQGTPAAMTLPQPGDEIVQYGSATNPDRQSAIYLHADGDGHPAIDLLEGIHERSFQGCLRLRIGGELPGGGFGLYSLNGRVVSQTADGRLTHYDLRPDGTFTLGRDNITYDGTTLTLRQSTIRVTDTQGQEALTIDPTTGRYLFRGEIQADSGRFTGLTVGMTYGNIRTITADTFLTLFHPAGQWTDPDHDDGAIFNLYQFSYTTMARVVKILSVPDSVTSHGDYGALLQMPPFDTTRDSYDQALTMVGTSIVYINAARSTTNAEGTTTAFLHGLQGNFIDARKYYTHTEAQLTDEIEHIIYVQSGDVIQLTLVINSALRDRSIPFFWIYSYAAYPEALI